MSKRAAERQLTNMPGDDGADEEDDDGASHGPGQQRQASAEAMKARVIKMPKRRGGVAAAPAAETTTTTTTTPSSAALGLAGPAASQASASPFQGFTFTPQSSAPTALGAAPATKPAASPFAAFSFSAPSVAVPQALQSSTRAPAPETTAGPPAKFTFAAASGTPSLSSTPTFPATITGASIGAVGASPSAPARPTTTTTATASFLSDVINRPTTTTPAAPTRTSLPTDDQTAAAERPRSSAAPAPVGVTRARPANATPMRHQKSNSTSRTTKAVSLEARLGSRRTPKHPKTATGPPRAGDVSHEAAGHRKALTALNSAFKGSVAAVLARDPAADLRELFGQYNDHRTRVELNGPAVKGGKKIRTESPIYGNGSNGRYGLRDADSDTEMDQPRPSRTNLARTGDAGYHTDENQEGEDEDDDMRQGSEDDEDEDAAVSDDEAAEARSTPAPLPKSFSFGSLPNATATNSPAPAYFDQDTSMSGPSTGNATPEIQGQNLFSGFASARSPAPSPSPGPQPPKAAPTENPPPASPARPPETTTPVPPEVPKAWSFAGSVLSPRPDAASEGSKTSRDAPFHAFTPPNEATVSKSEPAPVKTPAFSFSTPTSGPTSNAPGDGSAQTKATSAEKSSVAAPSFSFGTLGSGTAFGSTVSAAPATNTFSFGAQPAPTDVSGPLKPEVKPFTPIFGTFSNSAAQPASNLSDTSTSAPAPAPAATAASATFDFSVKPAISAFAPSKPSPLSRSFAPASSTTTTPESSPQKPQVEAPSATAFGDGSKLIFGTPSAGAASFSFGPPAGTATPKPSAGFSFGTVASKPAEGNASDTTKSSFSFGAPPTAAPSSSSGASLSTGFSFAKPTAPPTAFSFGTPAASTASPFSFNLPSSGPVTSAAPDAGAGEADKDDEDAAPQEEGFQNVRSNDDLVKEGQGEEDEESVHQVRAKIWKLISKDNGKEWSGGGVGWLKVNRSKSGAKSRLLARLEGTGNILINFHLQPNFKADISGKTLTFPGFDGVKPTPFRLMVKTPEAAQELHRVLQEETKRTAETSV